MADDSSPLRPEVTALAIALGVVAVHASAFPSMPISFSGALLNEGLIWFVALYGLLLGLTALSKRVARPGGVLPGAGGRAPRWLRNSWRPWGR